MFKEICEAIRSHIEFSFQELILPVVTAIGSIAALWIFLLFISFWISARIKKWQEDPKLEENFYKKFFVMHRGLFVKSINAFRWVSSISILCLLTSELLGVFVTKWHAVNDMIAFFDKSARTLMVIFFVVLVAMWAIRFVQHGTVFFVLKNDIKSKSSEHYGRKKARNNTLTTVMGNFLKIVVTIIAIFTILQNMGINIAALLATAGIASVAFGFGAQTLVRDFISGFYILFEDQFAVGDQVEINSFSGTVESMTLRVVRLRSQEGSFVVIPNGDIRAVKNFTTDWARVDFRYAVPLTANLQRATEVVQSEVARICETYKKEIIGKPEIRPIEKIVDFENRSTAALFRVFIKTQNIEKKLKIEMDLNRGVMQHHNALMQVRIKS